MIPSGHIRNQEFHLFPWSIVKTDISSSLVSVFSGVGLYGIQLEGSVIVYNV